MRVVVASRVFVPEPTAASFRLNALATALAQRGHEVTVLTTTFQGARSQGGSVRIRRMPVLRDKTGYVRGYLQYLSFDIPLAFRLLFSRRADVVIAEPPPTTGFVVRVLCALRRTPYVAYAPDLWSEAMASVKAAGFVKRAVRALERGVYRHARLALSVSPDITSRLEDWMPAARIATVGNGIDTSGFTPDGDAISLDGPYLLYAGTASEFQGASIFAAAFEEIAEAEPNLRLVFLGQGSEFEAIREVVARRGDDRIQVLDRVATDEAARWIRGAQAALVSIRPGMGYDFAIPTKIYAAVSSGTPVIYAGVGAARDLIRSKALGWDATYEVEAIAKAMREAVASPVSPQRRAALAKWARSEASLSAAAQRAADAIEKALGA